MQNALRLLTVLAFIPAIAGCHKDRDRPAPDPNVVGIDNDAATPANIEALPADESSATPSNQLVNGDDSPDVNDTSTSNSD